MPDIFTAGVSHKGTSVAKDHVALREKSADAVYVYPGRREPGGMTTPTPLPERRTVWRGEDGVGASPVGP